MGMQRHSPRRNALAAAAVTLLACATSLTIDFEQSWWVRAETAAADPVGGIRASIVNEESGAVACTSSTDAAGWCRLSLHVETKDTALNTSAYSLRLRDADDSLGGGRFDTVSIPLDFSADTVRVTLQLLPALP